MSVDAMGQTLAVGQTVIAPCSRAGHNSGLRFGVITSIGKVRVVIEPLKGHPKALIRGGQRYFSDVLIVQL